MLRPKPQQQNIEIHARKTSTVQHQTVQSLLQGAKLIQQFEEIWIFRDHHMGPNMHRITRHSIDPATCSTTNNGSAFQDIDFQAAFGQSDLI